MEGTDSKSEKKKIAEGVDGEADRSQSGRDLFTMIGNLGFIQSAIGEF